MRKAAVNTGEIKQNIAPLLCFFFFFLRCELAVKNQIVDSELDDRSVYINAKFRSMILNEEWGNRLQKAEKKTFLLWST